MVSSHDGTNALNGRDNEERVTDKLTQFRQFLDEIERWRYGLDLALREGSYSHSFDDLVGMLLSGKLLFYSYPDCFLVMEKNNYPQYSAFHCYLAGGSMDAVLSAQDDMQVVARNLGCQYLSIAGRKGWERALKDRGWQFVCTTMHLEIGRADDERTAGRVVPNNDCGAAGGTTGRGS